MLLNEESATVRRDFCTYFDHRYLTKGLALYRSLERHAGDFRLLVLCLTRESRAGLERLGLAHARFVSLDELEAFDPELAAVKSTRSAVEYYFTCTAPWMRFVLSRESDIELLTYLDADLFFYASPEPLFEEIGSGSIAIVPHRFAPALANREVYGRFNVGWVSFSRGAEAAECLERWRTDCLDWCYDRVEGERFADQKYLDAWPARHRSLVVLGHPGADLAPWNLDRHSLTPIGENEVLVDGRPLLFFHFQGAELVDGRPFDPHFREYGVEPNEPTIERICAPYLRALEGARSEIESRAGASISEGRLRIAPGGSSGPGSVGGIQWPRISLVTPSAASAMTTSPAPEKRSPAIRHAALAEGRTGDDPPFLHGGRPSPDI